MTRHATALKPKPKVRHHIELPDKDIFPLREAKPKVATKKEHKMPETEVAEPEAKPEAEVPEQQAITVGGTIAATTTIDAIMTSLFATRSADLSATPVYTWAQASPPQLNATWAAANNPSVMMVAKFEIRNCFGPANTGGAISSVGP